MFKYIRKKKFTKKAIAIAVVYLVVKWTLILGFGSYLISSPWWRHEYFAAIPVLAGIGGFIYWRKKQKKKNLGVSPLKVA